MIQNKNYIKNKDNIYNKHSQDNEEDIYEIPIYFLIYISNY